MKKEKHNSKKTFDSVPGNIPDKKLVWQKIEENLLTDNLYYEHNKESLHNAIENLPEINPPKNIWNEISDELPLRKINGLKQNKRMYVISGIAASLIVGLLIGIFTKYQHNKNITYTKETIQIIAETTEAVNYNDFRNKIAALCENKPGACQNKDFINLTNELEKLIKEKQRLKEEVLLNSSSDVHTYQAFVDEQIKNIEYQIITFLTI